MAVAGPSNFIDLTVDLDDSLHVLTNNYAIDDSEGSIIILDDESYTMGNRKLRNPTYAQASKDYFYDVSSTLNQLPSFLTWQDFY